ncbi:hypothetical protein [Cryobacterium zhongshanensis]|uniref:Uncharacterized protein n=1 Tax=Cryobacterium zhongshanensis TaxID=2928153 RepID=A0AA41QXY3_9MICO|nr:hypothetical protein [Cryobacterium zhongshanensis]MCI4657976.1 hypothetical protein [Cryobacterium zhongshanensis]
MTRQPKNGTNDPGTPGDKDSGEHGLLGAVSWLNRTLLPWIGPPPLGPYTTETTEQKQAERAEATCPICGELMSRHEIDRSGERTQIHHPAPAAP